MYFRLFWFDIILDHLDNIIFADLFIWYLLFVGLAFFLFFVQLIDVFGDFSSLLWIFAFRQENYVAYHNYQHDYWNDNQRDWYISLKTLDYDVANK